MKAKRTKIFSGTPWEPKVGYARAVLVGDTAYVSGTTATDPSGKIIGPGDMYAQTVQTIRNIESALTRLGMGLENVVRTRMFVTDISRFEEYAKAHGEAFSTIKHCTSMLEVKGLVSPEYLVEIEATAILAE